MTEPERSPAGDRVPVGVLISGAGTNLQALLDATAAPDHPARIAVVVSNRRDAAGLDRARAAGVPAVHVGHRQFANREAYDIALVRVLHDHQVAWVAMAGFMRLVTPVLLDAFPNRVLNVHPSLLPAFPGLDAQRQAVDYGVRIAGCTVHLVDAGTDSGPILAQGAVPVRPDDDVDAVRRRILALEHVLYPRVLTWAAEGRIVREGRITRIHGIDPSEMHLFAFRE